MSIRAVDASYFMGLHHANIDLSAAPIHVITGQSGAGKSTIIDAVYWALWGTTFRRAGNPAPFGKKDTPEVSIDIGDFRIFRRGAVRQNVMITAKGKLIAQADTQKKAAELVAELVGPKLPWEMSSIVTTEDLAFFSASTDLQRKEFLEEALDISMFALAEEMLKGKARAAEGSAARAQQAIETSKHSLSDIEASIRKISSQIGPAPEKPPVSSRELLEKRDAIPIADVQAEVSAKAVELEAARKSADAIRDGTCPICNSPTTALIAPYDAKVQRIASELASLREELSKLQRTRAELQAQWERALTMEQNYSSWVSMRDRQKAHLSDLEDMRQSRLKAIAESEDLYRASASRAELARKAAAVCSAKGVRAYLLEYILPILQDTTNAYLGMMNAPFGIRMSCTSQRSGQTTIDFAVDGAGGGSFWASSEGERQRMALCVRLALAACIDKSRNLFLDEVYAHLDDTHIDGFVALLHEIAKDRTVVLITHDADVASAVGGKRYHVERGELIPL